MGALEAGSMNVNGMSWTRCGGSRLEDVGERESEHFGYCQGDC